MRKKSGRFQNTGSGCLGYGMMRDFSLSCSKLKKKKESGTLIIKSKIKYTFIIFLSFFSE